MAEAGALERELEQAVAAWGRRGWPRPRVLLVSGSGLGADLVGMSTVLEVIAARHMGLSCLVVSLVANAVPGEGKGAASEPVTHTEVLKTAASAADDLVRLLRAVLEDERLVA